ncbi:MULTISPECIES: hypothetical protein [unclassified Streptomyces]|uniref:hypothetical protein n=1 Tax=unclassified Streptomyces TaxID=2593676 RepID=UPI002E28A38D|nr:MULTISPECIES: hypothetical protein [unclassified Streptomyces]WUB85150.1 hypothetical protein OG812_00320 [Streptomyces sp. NBC_00566]
MTAGWCSRSVRAAVFAAVCVVLAALGHVMMSGTHVPAWAFTLGAVATGAVGWALAVRERGLPLIVTTVVATQMALHTAFSHAQSIIEVTPAPGGGGGTGAGGATASMGMSHMSMDTADMGMSHMSMDHMATSHSAMSRAAAPGEASSYGMLAAHLLAAVLTGLWLAYGEKAAFRIMRAIAGRLAAPLLLLLGFKVTTDHPVIRVPRSRSRRVRGLLLVHAITSRGPPPGTAVI